MRGHYKSWAIPYLLDHEDVVLLTLKDFKPKPPLYLEIGCGKGDFLVGKSKQGGVYLGIEKDSNVLAMAAKKIVEENIINVFLFLGDVDEIYEDLKAYKFENIYLNFPDPWPKKKHTKRRLTNSIHLEKLAALLKKGGSIILKTDGDTLFQFSLEEASEAGLVIDQIDDDYQLEENDVQTEYETRFRNEGVKIKRAIFKKKED